MTSAIQPTTIRGRGPDLLFQHGLGGGCAQVDALLDPADAVPLPVRRITVACRGHDGVPLGRGPATLAAFAADVEREAEAISPALSPHAVLGGISMGAAIALLLAVRRPAAALILVRPAWDLGPDAPPNLRMLRQAATTMTAHGADGRALMRRSPSFAALARTSPDNATSLLAQWDAPDLHDRARLLSGIAGCPLALGNARPAPACPVLIVSCPDDALHPAALAASLCRQLKGRTVMVPSKSADPTGHGAAVRAAMRSFLAEVFDRMPAR